MFGTLRNLFIAACCALVVGVQGVFADERSEALDREATTLYQQVFSPFCPGRSLNDCPSSKAAELKDQMRAELDAGTPPEVILNEVFRKYGDQYRAVPPFAGVGMLVWLAPIGFVVFGLILALCVSNGRKKNVDASSRQPTSPISEQDERRIQEELSMLD